MRDRIRVLLLCVSALSGCRGDNIRSADDPTGVQRILAQGRQNWPAWGPAYFLHYETATPVWDVPQLRSEAETLWTHLRPRMEDEGYCTVNLKASEPTRRAPLPGTRAALTARRNWAWMLYRRRDGIWEWRTSTDAPSEPCTPKPRAPAP